MSTFRSFLRAGGRLYRRLFQRRLDPQIREVADILQAVPALGHLSSRALHAMAAATHRRTYRRGESLYYEGDPGLGLYVVESGQVRLVSDPESGRNRELRELAPNDMFGELSILGDFRRLETAETVTEARVLGFFRPDLKNVMRRYPKAGTEIVMALARRVTVQHVEAVRLLKERAGRDAALDVYAEAAGRMEEDAPPLS
ncbi:MAG: Crp/Fnr family transcriptional regulator [Bacteroidetes bacterium SW_9_63_38]|nr:MAG: Crp/Fnr family transcriptional regulator [Bacteroidetes bacterium SW_9_63_38]